MLSTILLKVYWHKARVEEFSMMIKLNKLTNCMNEITINSIAKLFINKTSFILRFKNFLFV